MKVKQIFLASHEHGWNVKENRPATRRETYYASRDVCLCEYCADDPHYGSHYCKRYGEDDSRFYSDHFTRWNRKEHHGPS